MYVDNFCYAATQSDNGAHIPIIRRAAIHGIHAVFPPTSVTNHKEGKEPISAKKLAAGDGNFNSKKDMIGFSFDGIKRTVHLPPAKAKAYITKMHTLLRRKTVPLKKLQTLVGKLRHAAIILPAAKGFFTPLNDAMHGSPKTIGLGTYSEVRQLLLDLISLLHLLSSRPTHVRELVPDMPKYAGYHDAAAEGAGGIWFSLCNDISPLVWREEFPADIAAEVVSEDTPHGQLTNSDLELAAEVLVVGVALDWITNPKHIPLETLCDNTPTVSWIDKMASKSKSPTAGRLLRGLAFMLYCTHAGRLTTVHVPGVDTVMADIASRPSKAQKLFRAASPLSDPDFCASFDFTFPLPDNQTWTLATMPQWLRFNVFETLRRKRLDLQQWTGPNSNVTSKCGKCTAGSTADRDTPGKILTPALCTDRLLTFAVAVREGKYGLGHQVKVQSVATALRLVSQKLVLDGHPDPRRASPAQHALDLPISRLLKKYNEEDPPAEPKLAIPISMITSIAKNYRWTPHLSAAANLVIIAFFYLL